MKRTKQLCLYTSFLLTVCCTKCTSLFSQNEIKRTIDIDKFIQDSFQQQDEDFNYEDLYEALYQYYTEPLDLNSASREDFQSLHILSENQINQFFSYINKNGSLVSLFELQAIPDFDLISIERILPFVTLNISDNNLKPKHIFGELARNDNKYMILRYSRTIEKRKGYEEKKYVGSPDKIYFRLRSSTSKKSSCGITLEKDAGEKIAWDPSHKTYGSDYISYHYCFYDRKKIKTFIAGDYQMQFGQGLLLGAGFKFGKGAEPVNMVKRNNLGARPYTSVVETGFFRGLAVSVQPLKSMCITAFYSSKNIDGNLTDSSVSSLSSFGYHRTASEIQNKGMIKEMSSGGNISLTLFKKNLHLGLTALNTTYNIPFIKAEHPYNLFEFSGSHNLIYGADFSFLFRNFNFFAEAGRSGSHGTGLVGGFISSLARNVDVSFILRNYDKNFHTFYGKAFGENSRNINEQGMYWGIKITPASKWIVSAYYDRFYFPWIKYRVDAPSSGNETMLRLSYTPAKKIQMYFQCRIQQKEGNVTVQNQPMHLLIENKKINYLLNLDYTFSPHLTLKTRIQSSNFTRIKNTTSGYYMMQEMNIDYKQFSLDLRFSVFDTDDYDNRQFVYERDVQYAFSIPQLYGKGTRYYITGKIKFNRKTEFSFKYASTTYYNVNTIGSGLEEIKGNRSDDLKLQLLYKM